MISRPARWSSNVSMRRISTPSAAGGSSASTIAAATGSHGGSGSRQPSARRRSGNDGGSAVEPMFQKVRSMSPTQPEDLAGGRGDRSRLVRDSQAADAGPAPLRADRDAVPVVDDPLGALGRLEVEAPGPPRVGRAPSSCARTGCAM